MYVRVHGHLRGLQGRRFLNVFSIRYAFVFPFLSSVYFFMNTDKVDLQPSTECLLLYSY